MIEALASYQHCVARITENWTTFQTKRLQRLVQHDRHGAAAERVAENILEDLFTQVLDWSISDVNNQVGYADLTLTRLGIKELIIETKRPGKLAWHRHAVNAALEQALGYAHEQKVQHVAVSDGTMFYAADVQPGGLTDRLFCTLDSDRPVTDLWWVSVHGIYRTREGEPGTGARRLPDHPAGNASTTTTPPPRLLHPKYQLPSWCFAYVGDATNPSTWKLPYLKVDASVDGRRLPKAIQSILSNYRGATVNTIPETAIPDVLVRLGAAAFRTGKMPGQNGATAAVYKELAMALEQRDRLGEIDDT